MFRFGKTESDFSGSEHSATGRGISVTPGLADALQTLPFIHTDSDSWPLRHMLSLGDGNEKHDETTGSSPDHSTPCMSTFRIQISASGF